MFNNWQHINFADGSNPYICKTEKEFKRIAKKYKLQLISSPWGVNFWRATK